MRAPLVLSRAQRFARFKDFQCALISTMQHLSEPVKPCDLICACSSGPLQGAEVCAIKRFSVCCHFSCGTQRVLKFLLALIATVHHLSDPVKPCDLICACSSGPLQGPAVCAIKRFSVCCHLWCAESLEVKSHCCACEIVATIQ